MFKIDVTHVGFSNFLDTTIYSGKDDTTWLDLKKTTPCLTDVSENVYSIDRQVKF